MGRVSVSRRTRMSSRGTAWRDTGTIMSSTTARTRQAVSYNKVALDVIVDGEGPAIVLLPWLARDSEDYDVVAAGLAQRGFRVLRPQPRGVGASTGPMTGITLHDFARDIAETIKALGGGR